MSAAKILLAAFEKKKRENPKLSRQSVADKIGISRPLLSQILGGKRNVPLDKLDAIARALDLDKEKRDQLVKLVLGRKNVSLESSLVGERPKAPKADWEFLAKRQFGVLQDWFYLAVLEATQLEAYDGTTAFLARSLKLEPALVERALALLEEQKMLERRGGKKVKRRKLLDAHSVADKAAIRAYHTASMQKAMRELRERTGERDVAKRLVTGLTLTMSRDRVAWIQQKISDLLTEAAESSAESPAEEVYQFSVQFFPLTNVGE